jgi:hypothetical protein
MNKFLAVFILLICSLNSFASYEMILFSYDHKLIPGWSPHTFALFYEKSDKTRVITNSSHISWLPKSSPSDVEVFSKSVKGKNYSLAETFRFAIQHEKKIYYKGPFKIKKELFTKAQAQQEKLESGSVKYKVLWTEREGKELTFHCVYAISDLHAQSGLMSNGISHTLDSMEKIQIHFKQYILSRADMSKTVLDHFKLKPYLERMEIIND